MANYNQNIVNGDSVSWTRPFRIEIDNPHNETPTVTYREEIMVALPDGSHFSRPVSVISRKASQDYTFDLLNPATGQPLGQQMTELQMQVAIYSHYIAVSKQRDLLNGL